MRIPQRISPGSSGATDLPQIVLGWWTLVARYVGAGRGVVPFGAMSEQIPLVDYLVLGDQPHLVAKECTGCGARYFDRRNACAGCFGSDFTQVSIVPEGTVTAFTIVAHAAPGIPTPFVSAVIDCAGTPVRGNLINVDPDPDHVSTGMPVRLATYSLGADDHGVEAIGFGFEPAQPN